MNDQIIDSIKLHAQELSELIQAERYIEAQKVQLELDKAIRTLDRQLLGELSMDERKYLVNLAHWLSDEDRNFEKRSKQLIDAISPFNQNSTLNSTKRY